MIGKVCASDSIGDVPHFEWFYLGVYNFILLDEVMYKFC